MKVIGLAGRPGSGKSAVARDLARQPGVEAVDLDCVSWATYVPGTPTYERLVSRFGREILSDDGRIDRERLAAAALSEEAGRRDLEAIVHPAVGDLLRERIRDAQGRSVRVLVVEGALLASSSHVDRSVFDALLWLDASDATRERRLRAQGRAQHADRMRGVSPRHGTIVVDAEGNLGETVERVRRLIEG